MDHYKCQQMKGTSILYDILISNIKEIGGQYCVKMGGTMSRWEVLCQDGRHYVKMGSNMSRWEVLCKDGKYYVKMGGTM